jgi:hypothetical protein
MLIFIQQDDSLSENPACYTNIHPRPHLGRRRGSPGWAAHDPGGVSSVNVGVDVTLETSGDKSHGIGTSGDPQVSEVV